MVLECYHGTTVENAVEIDKIGFQIIPNSYQDHWLGDGVYFYTDKNFAKKWKKKAVVYHKNIEINEDDVYNLDDFETYHDFIKHYFEFLAEFEKELEINNLQIADNQVIGSMQSLNKFFDLLVSQNNIKVIKKIFPESTNKTFEYNYNRNGSKEYNYKFLLLATQICVTKYGLDLIQHPNRIKEGE